MHSSKEKPLVGVIDIGSNSVRLVVYDSLSRIPVSLFNEKSLCGLGRGLSDKKQKLDKNARKTAAASIARFAYIAQMMGVGKLYAIATAAMRDAADGAEFIQQMEAKHQLNIRIISGEEEALLAAQGVQASISNPCGIAGDMGGGSLELVAIDGNEVGGRISLPLGALRLLDLHGTNEQILRNAIKDCLKNAGFKAQYSQNNGEIFYAIGGGFRGLAQAYIEYTGYPLPILHYYTVSSESLVEFLQKLIEMPSKKRVSFKGIPENRSDAMIPTAIVLEEIINFIRAKKVVFSAAGIREGLLYSYLPEEIQNIDPLDASIARITKNSFDESYTKSLFKWLTPLFPAETAKEQQLRQAFCSLSDVALPIHNEFRADWAFRHIVESALWGITHDERVMLGLALYYRYRYRKKPDTILLRIVSEKQWHRAKIMGIAASLAFEFSGGISELLNKSQPRLDKNKCLLEGDDPALALSESMSKKLDALNKALKGF